MDINRIFGLFNNQQQPEDDETSLLIDFSEHPLFWISGFNKVISNHLFFKQYTAKMLKEISAEIDVKEVEDASEALMFEQAWNYIKNFKVDNSFHIDCLKTKVSNELENNLIYAIQYFENLEEYEKCALLKGVETKVKEFLT